MELLHSMLQILLHLDHYLVTLAGQYGVWTYAILFAIIFCETGLVICPFLPGDSLLFATGALAASVGALNIHILFALLVIASFSGNAVNYFVGKKLGPKIFYSANSFFLNKQHLWNANQFYLQHGTKTVIIARFIPIIRTFAPFVAGIASMNKRRFLLYNLVGAIVWIGLLLYTSFLFGNQPFIKNHFSTVIFTIIFITMAPAIIALARQLLQKTVRAT